MIMNPSSSGWVKKFFSLFEDLESLVETDSLNISSEEKLYGYLQPTGIMYGFPSNFLFVSEEHYRRWSREEKFKVLLLESLIISDFVYRGKIDMNHTEEMVRNFVAFYEDTAIETAKRNWLNFKGSDDFEKLESIIDQRIDIKTSFSRRFWTAYLNNSLVFQDLVFYTEYLQNPDSLEVGERRFEVLMNILKVVSVAAHSDGEISEEEEALFDIMMISSRLSGEDKDEVKAFWNENRSLNDIPFKRNLSWLMKRYFMEVATLTVWSDKKVTPGEQLFLDQLAKKLMIDDEEQDKSFIAIQSFVLENEAVVPFLNGKNETTHFVDGAVDKWKRILGRNKDKLALEVQQSRDLMKLIVKSTTSDLSAEERKRAKSQMKDLARTIPALSLFMLPGGTLIMPLVLKLIPDLVPTAFRSNQIEEIKKELEEEEKRKKED